VRVGQPLQERSAPVLDDDRFDDLRRELRHPPEKPGGRSATVEGKVGATGTARHDDKSTATSSSES
jgi:hypothetical protein